MILKVAGKQVQVAFTFWRRSADFSEIEPFAGCGFSFIPSVDVSFLGQASVVTSRKFLCSLN